MFNWNFKIKFQSKITAIILIVALLFSSTEFGLSGIHVKADGSNPYWDNTSGNSPISFGALPKTSPSSPTNVVTLKKFMQENGTGTSFALMSKYKSGADFSPASCTIMIEDAADLLQWSKNCYFKYDAATNPTLERSVYLSARYVLGNNVDYGSTVGFIPIGFAGTNDSNLRFTGTFDGQGFEISNLKLTTEVSYFLDESANPCSYYSMFANIGAGGVVKNLGLRSPTYTEPYGVNLSLKIAGVAGYNRGTVQYCFVVAGTAKHSSYDAAEITGVVHTNDSILDNIYYAGDIANVSNHANTKYNPVVFLNTANGTITSAYYDSTIYGTTVNTTYATVVAKTTAELQGRSGGILSADQWYTDNYTRTVTDYVVGYPRLQGFKYNNSLVNSTTNPYYLQRPADLIFFSIALSNYTLFSSTSSRYFRLLNCIDMTTVSDSAFVTPSNDFNGNFEGTIDDASKACIADHVGTADQLACHSIINLRQTVPLYKTIVATSTKYIIMGLVYNNATGTVGVKNINMVGGKFVLPELTEAQANNTLCSVAAFVSYTNYATIENVHSSADIIAFGDGDYISKLRMGGIVGGARYAVNVYKSSNNGTIDGGRHIYVSTAANTFSFGGIVGEQGQNGSNRRLIDCSNYGTVTGVSITANQGVGLAGISYVGGIVGYSPNINFTIDRLFNEGAIYSLEDVADGATNFPIIQYNVGGIFGSAPSGPTGAVDGVNPTDDTRMFNKGNIYANKVDNTTVGAAKVAGIAGNSGSTNYYFKNASNAGNIVLAKDLQSVFAAGISNGTIYLFNCYNDGSFVVEDNSTLAPIYETRIYGISGGSNTNTSNNYKVHNCYNLKDINLNFKDSIANIRIAGIAYNMPAVSCVNSGKITVNAENITTTNGKVYVAGVAEASINAVSCTNNGDIVVNALDLTSDLCVGGVINSLGSGTANTCVNNGNITVKRSNKNAASMTQNTYIAGIKVGYLNNGTEYLVDCQNNGEIAYDSFYTADASSYTITSNLFMAGVAVYALNINRCVNNGALILAKTNDFTGTSAYVAGIVYASNYNSDSNIVQNCRNLKPIYNVNNIGVSANSTTRNIYFSGIVHQGSANMSRLVNTGDITMTSWNTSNNVNFYVNGVADYTGNITSSRVTYGVKGLANVGQLKIDHSQTVLPQYDRIVISGVIRYLGVGDSRYATVLPFENLVNSGKIIALAKTDNSISYLSPGTDGYTSNTANVTVGGVSAMPGYNNPSSSTYPADYIPLKSSANTGDINVDLVCGSSTPSVKLIYNVGGVAGNSTSNSSGFSYQKLDIYDCVNGGNITVNTVNDTVNSSGQTGVGGILGFGYQYTYSVTTATESNVHTAIYNCINFATIEGGFSTGGIVGCDGAIIKNVINFGTVKGTTLSSTGGIIGAVRSARKNASYNTRLVLALDGIINYGTVQASGSQTPQYLGGIIGNMAVGQDATYGSRRYEKIINSTGVKFIGNTVAQNASKTTFGSNTVIDLATAMPTSPAVVPDWETSDSFFKNNIITKTNGSVTDSNSIYFKDTNNDNNSFFWRVGEDLPENNNCFVYTTPDFSSRNTYNEQTQTYSPYPNGIYVLSVNAGKKSGYYPSSNIIANNCDPILLSGSGYTAWRNTIIGSATRTVDSALGSLRQINLNTDAEILSLQLTSGGGTPTLLKSSQVITAESKVVFYVVKDNFTPTVYTPDMYSTNTVLSDKASFYGNVNVDLSSGFTFNSVETQTFTLTVQAEDLSAKDWTIVIKSVVAQPPLTLTQIKEGVSIINSSAPAPASPGYTLHSFTQREDGFSYDLGDVASTHNNTLIFNFNTVGLLPKKNMIGNVSLQTSTGTPVTLGAYSSGIGSANTTYYKVPAPSNYGVDSYNYTVISDDYTTYLGIMTVNINLHSNLSSGNYRIAIATTYGTYYYYFTRVLSSEAEVQIAPNVSLLSGTVGCSITSSTGKVYNSMSSSSTRVQYGNAPNLSNLTLANGMFSSAPTISKGATISSQRLISIVDTDPDNKKGAKTYTFGFTITSENGTVKNWTIEIVTQPYQTNPVAIEVGYNGQTYSGSQVTDPDIMYDTFVINKNQSGSFAIGYDTTNGSTGNNAFYIIKDNNYIVYSLYRNSVLIPESSYASYGITLTKQAISGSYLKVTLDATAALPNGSYELRAFFYRPSVAISPPVTDDSSNTYSQLTWTDEIQYPSFYFFKAEGKRLSYATGLTVPYVPDTFTFKSGSTSLYWDGTNINYDALGANITTEENANFRVHNTFDIVLKYKSDLFYYNFKPQFILPEGASLYRETLQNQWELVTDDNIAADFSAGTPIKYRVYAEDTRYYQDYTIQLLTVLKSKQFNINFAFANGASNTLPVNATLKSIDRDSNNNNIVSGSISVFSSPFTTYAMEKVPPGSYVLNLDVPYGYQASIVADNSPTDNDITVNGKLIAGNWKMVTAMTDVEQIFSITVTIEPIPNFSVPWGVRRIAQ